MTSRAVSSFLVTVSLGLGLAACSTEPRSDSPAPVIDRSVVPGASIPVETPVPPPLPQVRVQPLPRPLPLESGPPSAQPQMSMTPKPKPKPKPKPLEEVATAPPPAEPEPKATESPATPPAEASAPAPAPAPAPKREVALPPAEITPKGNQAVVALLDSAKQYVARSDWDKAAAALERAVRLEPKNAGIWHDLAQSRLQQRQYKQAEDLAAKSNSLAGNDRQVKSRNWKVISVSRRARGDDTGADAAEAQSSVER